MTPETMGPGGRSKGPTQSGTAPHAASLIHPLARYSVWAAVGVVVALFIIVVATRQLGIPSPFAGGESPPVLVSLLYLPLAVIVAALIATILHAVDKLMPMAVLSRSFVVTLSALIAGLMAATTLGEAAHTIGGGLLSRADAVAPIILGTGAVFSALVAAWVVNAVEWGRVHAPMLRVVGLPLLWASATGAVWIIFGDRPIPEYPFVVGVVSAAAPLAAYSAQRGRRPGPPSVIDLLLTVALLGLAGLASWWAIVPDLERLQPGMPDRPPTVSSAVSPGETTATRLDGRGPDLPPLAAGSPGLHRLSADEGAPVLGEPTHGDRP